MEVESSLNYFWKGRYLKGSSLIDSIHKKTCLFISNMEKMFPAEYETTCAGCTLTKNKSAINVNSVKNAVSNAAYMNSGLSKN